MTVDPVQTSAYEKRETLFNNIFLVVVLSSLAVVVVLLIH